MTLFCDGASRGNPGPGSYGFVIFEKEKIVAQSGGPLGIVTNNVAEYEGLVRGLKKSLEMGATEISVRADSELMVRQLNGIYKVKSPNILGLFQAAKTELKKFKKVDVAHIRREENSLADELCNLALDRGTEV